MGNEVATRTVRTRDGRELCIEVAGGGRERWVLVLNGLPNSRLLYGRGYRTRGCGVSGWLVTIGRVMAARRLILGIRSPMPRAGVDSGAGQSVAWAS
jgi:hypothetical protein